MLRPRLTHIQFIYLLLIIPNGAQAYIGPGASDSALGTTLIVLGVVLLIVIALMWYPAKVFLAKKKAKNSGNENT